MVRRLLPILLILLPVTSFAGKKHVPLDLAAFHNNQGVVFMGRNDLDRAEVEFKTAVEIDPLYAEGHNNLGLIYKYKGQFEPAIDSLKRAIKLNPKWAAPYNHLGTVYLSQGELDKAIAHIKKSTELDKKYADAFANLGVVHLEKAKKSKDPRAEWKNAMKAFQKATTIDTRLFHAHMDLADTYRKLGEIEKAILRYRLAIETNPKDGTAWQHLGELYLETGDAPKAEECFQKVRMLEPLTYFDLGFAYASQGQHPAAVKAYQRAVSLDPNFFGAWFNMGHALRALNDFGGAIHAFQQALRIKPDHPETLFALGDTFAGALRPREAFQVFCRFLQVAKKNLSEEIKKAKEAIRPFGDCPH